MKTKRIISILLTLCMLLALLPTAAIPARAARSGAGDGTVRNCCHTGGIVSASGGKYGNYAGWDFTNTWYMGGDAPELRAFIKHVSTWTDLKAALQAGGAIVLTADVAPDDAFWDDALTVPSGVTATLDLNGHIVDRGYTDASTQLWDGSVIKISGTLTLLDSDPTAAHDPEFTYTDPITERAMTVNGGVITGGHPDQYGGGVQVQGGTFDMRGGSIACNSVGKNGFGAVEALGGGVYMQSGTFNMSGGAIVGNKASNKNTMMPDTMLGKGGAVYIANGGFSFSGGLIRGNVASTAGGGIYVGMNGTFDMTGGIIVGNTAPGSDNVYDNDGGAAPGFRPLSLRSNDGNDYSVRQFFVEGSTAPIASDVFVRDGYEFKGWSEYIDGSGANFAEGAEISTDHIRMFGTLYAQWEALNYTVAVTRGENMTKTTSSGAVSQTVSVGSAMTAVVYTANDGYYFPLNYSVDAVNGVTVTRDSFTQITVSGTPTADAAITLTAATAKNKEQTPTAIFTATGADTGTLSNVAAGMKYKIDNGEWQTATGDSVDLADLAPCTITIYTPGNGTTTVDSDEQTITVTKAETPDLAVTQPSVIGGRGVVETTDVHEWSSNTYDWEDCYVSQDWPQNCTIFIRVKASGTVLASDYQTVTINAFVPTQEPVPSAVFTATGADTGMLSNVANGMKYKIDNGEWQTATGTSVDLTDLAPCTITIYTPGNGTTTIDSDEQTIIITKAETPNLTAIQPETINGKGAIPTTTEHQKSTNGTDWEDCDSEWTGLTEGTYYVRVKANGAVLASEPQNIEIIAFVPAQEQTPEAIFTATGADTGTLSNVAAGMKYKIDNGEWQTISGTSVDLTNLASCAITIYTPGNGTTTIDSDEQTIIITKAETPNLTAIQPETINGKGAIPTTTEHQKSTNGTDWEDCGGEWADLGEGTYYVRVKAAGTALASDIQTIIISAERYTVKFVDGDGTELQSTVYACGETPIYSGDEPTKAATAENTYTFAGWTPEIVPVTEDTTYTAKYDAAVNEYTVTFVTNDGSEIQPVQIRYGEPVAEPETPVKTSFAFAGWFADEGLETPYDFTAKITSDTKVYAKWTPISYPVIGKDNFEWTKGCEEDVVVTVKRSDADETCFDHFIGVEIDGQPLQKDADYTAVKGSVVIVLKAATLEKLSVGEHTVTIIFDDGRVDTKLTVKAAPNNDPVSPRTGDNSRLGLWIALMIVSFCGLATTHVIDKKKGVFGR